MVLKKNIQKLSISQAVEKFMKSNTTLACYAAYLGALKFFLKIRRTEQF